MACMFELAEYTVGSVVVGIGISAIAIAMMFLFIKVLGRRKEHNILSISSIVIFSLLLLTFNILFCSLVSAKNEAADNVVEYNTNLYIRDGEAHIGITDQETKVKKIKRYLWLDGILCFSLFFAGTFASYGLMDKKRLKVSKQGYNEYDSF